MKTIIQTVLPVFFSIACFSALYSQSTVSYGYDSAGNRVSRTIVIPPKQAPAQKAQEEPVVYSEMLSGIELKIYPNPTDGLLKVEIHNLLEGQTADIRIYSLSGGLITSIRGITGFVDIDISNRPSGTYLMKITAGEYQSEWKIIKK